MKTNCVSVHKNAKRDLGQYPAILTSRLVNNLYSYSVLPKREVKMAGYWPRSLFAFLWTEMQSVFILVDTFGFAVF